MLKLLSIMILTLSLPGISSGPVMESSATKSELSEQATVKSESEESEFQKVKVTGSKGKYKVSGEVPPSLKEFYYLVEDGHEEWISERKVNIAVGNQSSKKFTLNIVVPPEAVPSNGSLILYLYGKKGSEKINETAVILEKSGQ